MYFMNGGNNWNTPNNINETYYNEIQFKDKKGIKKIFNEININDDHSSESQIINSTFINFPVNMHLPEVIQNEGGRLFIKGT